MRQVCLSFTCKPHPAHADETEELRDCDNAYIESMDLLRLITSEDLDGK